MSQPCVPRAPLAAADERHIRALQRCEHLPTKATWCEHLSICHNATHGLVWLGVADESNRSLLLRIGDDGPPQNVLFRRAASAPVRAWVAGFALGCDVGMYSASVYLLSPQPFLAFDDGVPFRYTPVPPRNLSDECTHQPSNFADVCPPYMRHLNAAAQKRVARQGLSARGPAPSVVLLERHRFRVEPSAPPPTACGRCLWTWRGAPRLSRYIEQQRERMSAGSDPSQSDFTSFGRHAATLGRELTWRDDALDAATSWFASDATVTTAIGPVCFLGDSHFRQWLNALVQLRARNCSIVGAQARNKSVCHEGKDLGTHFMLPMGKRDVRKLAAQKSGSKTAVRLDRCRAMLMGFGQWFLAFENRMHGGPMPLPTFEEHLTFSMGWLKAEGRRRGIPVAWLPAPPAPLVHGDSLWRPTFGTTLTAGLAARCPPREWRRPELLHKYYELSKALAAARNLAFIDFWELALGLMDLSFDGIHYAEPVAPAVARLIVHWLHANTPAPAATL